MEPVSVELLEKFVAKARADLGQESSPQPAQNQNNSGKFKLAEYLGHYGLEVVKVKQESGGARYCLKECVFDPSHSPNEAGIFQATTGKLSYQCFHQTCQGRKWADARAKISGSDSLSTFVEGGRQPRGNNSNGSGPAPATPENEQEALCLEDAILTDAAFIALSIPEKQSYLVPFLNEGSIVAVIGWRGVGKSLFTLGAVDAITKGLSFGPWECSKSVNCLIVDGEMAVQDCQRRVSDLGTEGRQSRLLYYSDAYAYSLGLSRASLLNEKWRSGLAEYMLQNDVRLWVCDNVASLARHR